MFYQTSMGLIYLIFNQLPFLWDTSDMRYISEKRYMDLVEMTSDISKQLSAWEKYERNKIKRGE